MLALGLIGIGANALAADTATVVVGATVLSKSNCKFNAPGTATLAFGNVDPASGSPATASTSLVLRCGGAAASATFNLTHDSGQWETAPNANRMKHATASPAEYMAYTLTLTPQSATIPKNTDQTITIDGSIAPADFQNASMGSYADSVVITLNP
ncbi:spore coat protein U domain-containing protein [Sulfurisoma sediminicola]|uniref:Spore coat protein U-like protein n=1 Tax=Sulfurisoma sediminicola TaxID=1381557 RepID=A0A497XAX6_9PROT|nr:spore coat protein U domain-containing protein [Sulfurisoma sediminicola]RLJ63714.1 spore coat protein U-like protein [Sulfurisoma sediminicola]